MVSWREQPTRYDIEAVQANTRRVGLVIRIRWALLIVLVVYSGMAGLAYTATMPISELAQRMLIPAMALLFVVMYNTFYQLNYKRLGNIAVWNNLQLALDAVVVTVLVYYSGGVSSWFWSMYPLFILEAAFILSDRRDAWGLAGICVVLLGSIEWLEFLHVLPHIVIPFAAADQYRDPVYVSVRYLWQVAVLCGTAAVATRLVGEQRADEAHRQSLVVLDQATNLYSRGFFLRALPLEVRRAQRDHRSLHVILLDIDRFGDFNRRFGIEAGDALLRLIAAAIIKCVSDIGDMTVTTNLAARFGGEEFVVMLAEDERIDGPPQPADAMRLAEQFRKTIAETTHEGAGVTVSVGVASMPGDGSNADELLDAADAALSVAVEKGGDRVVSAASLASLRMEQAIAAEAERTDSGGGSVAGGGPDDDRTAGSSDDRPAGSVAGGTTGSADDRRSDGSDDDFADDGFDASDLRSLDR
jgi:diguanylate cyclase (GGDEF)-like protein